MPNRIIKESLCYSEDIDRLTAFEETIFIRLIVNVDDCGRIDARPSFLKSKLFVTKQGITEKNIKDALQKLASVGLIRFYEVDGKSFLLFPKWSSHQRIRDTKAKYPAPVSALGVLPQIAADCGELPPESNPNPNPNPESKTNVGADAPRQRKKFTPPTFEEIRAYCLERKNNVDPKRFFDYFDASDWIDSEGKPVRNWKQKIITWEGGRNGGNQQKPAQPANPTYTKSDFFDGG